MIFIREHTHKKHILLLCIIENLSVCFFLTWKEDEEEEKKRMEKEKLE